MYGTSLRFTTTLAETGPQKFTSVRKKSYTNMAERVVDVFAQDSIMKSLYQYVTGSPSKVVCLTGPTGSGKTFVLERIATILNRRVVYLNDDDDETSSTSFSSLTSNSLQGQCLFVYDEPEGSLSKDLVVLLKARVVLVTTDLYGPLSGIKAKLQVLRMNAYTEGQKVQILRQSFDVSEPVLKIIAEACGQDIRYGLRLLGYALQTAKAKRPGHKTIVGPKDVSFDLFSDTANAFAKRPTTGVQGDDLFLYTSMLQTNCILRTKKVTKVLDAFSVFDVIETRKVCPTDMLVGLLETSLLDPIAKDNLEMFKVPNPGKKMSSLRDLSGQRDYADTIWALEASKDTPMKGLSADLRDVRKMPYVAKKL